MQNKFEGIIFRFLCFQSEFASIEINHHRKWKMFQGKIYRLIPSISSSHRLSSVSVDIRQSPRGERATLPILGPSGTQVRLN